MWLNGMRGVNKCSPSMGYPTEGNTAENQGSGFCGFRRINLTQKNNHTDFNESSNTCDWITLKGVTESDPKCIPAGFYLKRHHLKQPQQGDKKPRLLEKNEKRLLYS